MPIRIMHVVDDLAKGGLQSGLVNLIEHLDPAHFEHVVYAIRKLGPNADRLASRGVQVICQGKQDSDSPIQIATLARAIRRIRPDVVHSRNWTAVEAPLAGRWTGSCKVVHSEHGLEAAADGREPRRRAWFRRLAYELADRVLSVSYQLRDLHARRTGFDPARITVIHNGVDRRRFFPKPEARERARRELGFAEGDFCVGCVGNLFPVKSHITALAAMEGLAQGCPDWRLVLIGDGPERPRLESFVEGHEGWKRRVLFLGTREGVPDLLNALDAYVLPSISEGISNSLLEAMATGLAVVATRAGGNPEVVAEGDSGLLFPVEDDRALAQHLLALAAGRERRLALGKRALERVREEFSLESMVGRYAQLYENLGRGAAMVVQAAVGV